jgi:hypothetical protein
MNKDLVQKIPLLTVNAGPRDGDKWIKRYVHIYINNIIVSIIAAYSRSYSTDWKKNTAR